MKRALPTLLLFVLLTIRAHPQGCTQCRDNTAATPPKTQAAYRHAIILMTVTASILFLGTVAILRRQR
jgi:predicted small integral membrane protein